jgi:hypothetical protein
MRKSLVKFAIASALVLGVAAPAHAAHHLWRFSQLFSNAGGTTQFIQMTVNADGEQNVGAFGITTTANGGHTFNFVNNLPGSTTSVNKWILIATADFASQPGGITPDYIIPAHFFSTGGDTLSYANPVVDTWTFGSVPIDGKNALFKSGATVTKGLNAPANFNLDTGSVVVPAATAVPTAPAAWIAVLVGALLLAGSGLLRRQRPKRLPTTAI